MPAFPPGPAGPPVPFDLTAARAVAQWVMTDECIITRDAEGTDDDTLDQNTGVLSPPDPDSTTVYAGRCIVRPLANVPRNISEGGESIVTAGYRGAIPYTAAVPEPGDVLTITASTYDGALVGRSFRVEEVLVATMNVRRPLLLEART